MPRCQETCCCCCCCRRSLHWAEIWSSEPVGLSITQHLRRPVNDVVSWLVLKRSVHLLWRCKGALAHVSDQCPSAK